MAATSKNHVEFPTNVNFAKMVHALTNAKSVSKRIGHTVIKEYKDISWVRQQPDSKIDFNVYNFCKVVPSFCSVGQIDKDNIKISLKSDTKFDSRFVEKDIIFHEAGRWELEIDEVRVSLAELHIENTYKNTHHDVHNICSLVVLESYIYVDIVELKLITR